MANHCDQLELDKLSEPTYLPKGLVKFAKERKQTLHSGTQRYSMVANSEIYKYAFTSLPVV